MSQKRIQNRKDQLINDSKFMSKILNKLSSCVIIDEKTEGVNKRTVIKYLNTFAFETGFNPPSDEESNLVYYYLQDKKRGHVTKEKMQGLMKKCLFLYIESKEEPIGGIIDRLVLMLRNENFREKEKETQNKF